MTENEMYFEPRDEDEMPKFGGRRDKHDEHDNVAGQPKEIQEGKAQQARHARRTNKTNTLRGKAARQDGKGKR